MYEYIHQISQKYNLHTWVKQKKNPIKQMFIDNNL